MTSGLWSKMLEATKSVAPISLIMIIIGLTIVPQSATSIAQFLIACIFLIIGMSFFTLGADTAMFPVGQNVGSYLSKKNKVIWLILVAFVLGLIVTIAEPDLAIMAGQVSSVDKWVCIITVSVGVGLAMMLAVLRIIYKINLALMLAIIYAAIFILAIFVPNSFVPLCFDSGALTTGAISVPFILSFGVGIAAVRGSKSNQEDGFGLIALCSAAPIFTFMLVGCFVDVSGAVVNSSSSMVLGGSFGDVLMRFISEFPHYLQDVAIILLPIIIFFSIFQIFFLKLPKQQIMKIVFGLLYCFIGISIFFVGVNVGFLPMGTAIGEGIMSLDYNWIFVPIAMILGFVMIMAEPAVQVLVKQIEQITGGKLKASTIKFCMCCGVACSLGICVLKLLLDISFWWFIIPGYIIVFVLAFLIPKLFVGIAFDSGGVCVGVMCSTFVLPMMIGACSVLHLDVMGMAFGTMGYIALTPLLTIQMLGLIYKIAENRKKRAEEEATAGIAGEKVVQIYDYD